MVKFLKPITFDRQKNLCFLNVNLQPAPPNCPARFFQMVEFLDELENPQALSARKRLLDELQVGGGGTCADFFLVKVEKMEVDGG